jgi:hypothetical protein
MVILKALANARAVIEFKKGSFAQLIADGPDGTLAIQVTPQALADKMQHLIVHSEIAVRWGQAGFAKLAPAPPRPHGFPVSTLFIKKLYLSHSSSL